ncbi:uncharacterized protein EV422DRAFT_532386 [Fimicolochytrium jonesii]|uniref:uncharacterized protein n=1 Tax=Fimicolochytrium jonesii TaxID=1396493 RepID=UPI0022FDF0C3|nr:uncharacterized protein EV422DRAFT_532386 [Fimicolochytrium jonesii]KAI8819821.1 hypothetical protein EV422DRAFT_532386 [Fimicolochytrium jonesii]
MLPRRSIFQVPEIQALLLEHLSLSDLLVYGQTHWAGRNATQTEMRRRLRHLRRCQTGGVHLLGGMRPYEISSARERPEGLSTLLSDPLSTLRKRTFSKGQCGNGLKSTGSQKIISNCLKERWIFLRSRRHPRRKHRKCAVSHSMCIVHLALELATPVSPVIAESLSVVNALGNYLLGGKPPEKAVLITRNRIHLPVFADFEAAAEQGWIKLLTLIGSVRWAFGAIRMIGAFPFIYSMTMSFDLSTASRVTFLVEPDLKLDLDKVAWRKVEGEEVVMLAR